jgi:hypothetical protein
VLHSAHRFPMPYNQSISHPFDNLHLTNPHDQPAASSFPVFLTASVVLFAMDATIYLFRWRSREDIQLPADSTSASNPTTGPLRQFIVKAEEILEDVRELEMLASDKVVPSRRVRRRLITYGEMHDSCEAYTSTDKPRNDRTGSAFDSFCERLLLMNRIWKQERELKELRTALASKTNSTATIAFKTFCDQLLLWNRIWKLEKAVKSLVAEGEKMKRSRVMAITRAAKQMVLDVQKERLVEEFVKDLIEEVEENKRDMKGLREAHEREIEAMNGDWVKDYRAIVRELDALKLAQETRLLEQEIANDEEDSLYRNLLAVKRRVEELENEIAEYEQQGYTSSSDETVVGSTSRIYDTVSERDDEPTDVELDVISETSTSSTCVSVGRATSKAMKIIPRRRCISLRSPNEGHNASEMSLRPLTSDQARSISESNMSAATRTWHLSGRPVAFRSRTASSVSLKTLPSGTREKASGEIKKRAPWK